MNCVSVLFSRSRRCRLWLGIVALTLLPAMLPAAEATSIAYRVKAGYLFNFLKFAEWPASTLPPGSPLRIGIAGDDATFELLSTALHGKIVNERPIVVQRSENEDPASPPHLLFVTRSAGPSAADKVGRLADRPVLTVGESPDFARRHGILNFVVVDDAVRFEINLSAAETAGLRISSRISKLAILVRP